MIFVINIEDFDSSVPNIEYFIYRNNTSDWTITPSLTDFIDITYITSGTAVYTVNGKNMLVEEGDLLCIPKETARSAISSCPAQFSCFAVNFHMLKVGGGETFVPLPLVSKLGIKDDLIFQFKCLNEEWLRRRPGSVMQVRARFMHILQRLTEILVYEQDTYGFDPRIKTAIRYITDRYAEPISIREVAETVGLNQVYFGVLFKKETGMTFRDYINTIRLNQAEAMLRLGKFNITEVAQKCGFSDVFYFSRLFKKLKGVPPSSMPQ